VLPENLVSQNSLRITESPLLYVKIEKENNKSQSEFASDSKKYLRNILLMNRSLLTGFLFLPLGTSVHIYAKKIMRIAIKNQGG
jgi:hypothetical protein